jgi:hypothetical protein
MLEEPDVIILDEATSSALSIDVTQKE